MPESVVAVFGIRHHGPGCARSLRAALKRFAPDVVLVEGPPDAEPVLPLIAHPEMRPPVALLVYRPDAPGEATYFPLTIFSPEWQALRFAVERGIPARFMDLPQSLSLAIKQKETPAVGPEDDHGARQPAGVDPLQEPNGASPEQTGPGNDDQLLREDPIGLLARLAGYEDRELWWEHQVEQRQDATDLFEAILEMMGELRAHAGPAEGEEARREAHMRQTIRAAKKEGFGRIAVVCGAWHAPVLVQDIPAKDDAALLAGMPHVATTATWIPWTNSRLSSRSGYGAGIQSPGWYEHLWAAGDQPAVRWATLAARLLRERDLDASPASVIETVRLAEALAALRDLPTVGLAELSQAILTVLCHGEPAPLLLIRDKLEIGERLGAVPNGAPAVPLQRDLAAQQRRLRLAATAEIRTLDLDLRNATDLARSHLLHRLALLRVPWGSLQQAQQRTSTFHEIWQIQWQPELEVRLIEANIWGDTIEIAATNAARRQGTEATELPILTALLDAAILAALGGVVDHLLQRVADQAAMAADLRHLMDALPPLARVARYGDVRGTRAEQVLPVIDGLVERIIAGLVIACASLDDDAASAMVQSIGHVQESLTLLDRADQRAEWQDALRVLIHHDGIHGLVRGWSCRLLLESQAMDEVALERLARLALSPATAASQAAAWVEGVLRGSGLVLVHLDSLWVTLDRWLRGLDADTFMAVLPLLRRAFSGFQAPERRNMGEKVLALAGEGQPGPRRTGATLPIDEERAASVLPVLARILGVEVADAKGRA